MKRLRNRVAAILLSLALVLSLPVSSAYAEETVKIETLAGVPVVAEDEDSGISAEKSTNQSTYENEDESEILTQDGAVTSARTATVSLSEQTVYNRIVAQKSKYYEGMPWTNDNPSGGYFFYGYYNAGSNLIIRGYGCAAFVFEMNDVAFGSSLPAVDHHNWNNVRVGDILRINENTHSVIVLKVDGDIATVAEGNYNSSIHWGRKIRLSDYSSSSLNYITTRWTSAVKDTTTNATTTISTAPQVSSPVTVTYRTHVQSYGWQSYVTNGGMSGTSGEAKRLEAINIKVSGDSKLGIQYTTHCQDYGWLPWSSNGEMNGTEGEAKRLEAIMIRLTGTNKDNYDVYYRVHAQDYGWLGWAKNGAPAGTAGRSKRLEGIQIVVVPKGTSINKDMGGAVSANSAAYVSSSGTPTVSGTDTPNVLYRTHVQNYGWQGWKYNGKISGTIGQSNRLEGIKIKLTNCPYSGGISYKTHIQGIGWESVWQSNGAMSGTSGQAKRLEAIQIKLTGEMANYYDVYYRVHAQSYGWLGWAKNGAPAGTSGRSMRLEAIQIILVPKGSSAPSANYGGVLSLRSTAYIG
jgi:uncharacterized protein YjdB